MLVHIAVAVLCVAAVGFAASAAWTTGGDSLSRANHWALGAIPLFALGDLGVAFLRDPHLVVGA